MKTFDASMGFTAGLEIRTRVMGADFVQKALADASEFTVSLQQFDTVWCRGGINLKTRSLITIAMLATLERGRKLKGHVRGALSNGATEAEILEVLLHSAVYCVVPQATDAI